MLMASRLFAGVVTVTAPFTARTHGWRVNDTGLMFSPAGELAQLLTHTVEHTFPGAILAPNLELLVYHAPDGTVLRNS